MVAAEDAGITEAAGELQSLGADVQAVQVDLARYDGVEQLYARAVATGRPIAAIAINAGIGVGGPFAETDLADELQLVDLNVRSAVHLAKRAVQNMVPRGQGRILFTSSIAATQPGPFEAVYAASKAFVYSLSEALRNERPRSRRRRPKRGCIGRCPSRDPARTSDQRDARCTGRRPAADSRSPATRSLSRTGRRKA